jgi:hypothetical protein
MKTWLCKTGAPKILWFVNVYDHDFTVTFSLLKLVKLATKRGVPHFEPETYEELETKETGRETGRENSLENRVLLTAGPRSCWPVTALVATVRGPHAELSRKC